MNHPRITPSRRDLAAHTLARKLPPISRSHPLQWARTDHGALFDGVGDNSHLHSHITQVRVLHTDGTDTILPTAPPRQPWSVADRPEPAQPADPAAEMWHIPAHRAANITSAPQAERLQRAKHAQRQAVQRESDRIPTWLLGLAALVFVATIAISSVWPWGTALPLWK